VNTLNILNRLTEYSSGCWPWHANILLFLLLSFDWKTKIKVNSHSPESIGSIYIVLTKNPISWVIWKHCTIYSDEITHFQVPTATISRCSFIYYVICVKRKPWLEEKRVSHYTNRSIQSIHLTKLVYSTDLTRATVHPKKLTGNVVETICLVTGYICI